MVSLQSSHAYPKSTYAAPAAKNLFCKYRYFLLSTPKGNEIKHWFFLIRLDQLTSEAAKA
jgi:hypothetical protein